MKLVNAYAYSVTGYAYDDWLQPGSEEKQFKFWFIMI